MQGAFIREGAFIERNTAELKIREGNEDTAKIIFLISQ